MRGSTNVGVGVAESAAWAAFGRVKAAVINKMSRLVRIEIPFTWGEGAAMNFGMRRLHLEGDDLFGAGLGLENVTHPADDADLDLLCQPEVVQAGGANHQPDAFLLERR